MQCGMDDVSSGCVCFAVQQASSVLFCSPLPAEHISSESLGLTKKHARHYARARTHQNTTNTQHTQQQTRPCQQTESARRPKKTPHLSHLSRLARGCTPGGRRRIRPTRPALGFSIAQRIPFSNPSFANRHSKLVNHLALEVFQFSPRNFAIQTWFCICLQYLCLFHIVFECSPSTHDPGKKLVLPNRLLFFEYFPYRIKILFLSSQFYVIHIHR